MNFSLHTPYPISNTDPAHTLITTASGAQFTLPSSYLVLTLPNYTYLDVASLNTGSILVAYLDAKIGVVRSQTMSDDIQFSVESEERAVTIKVSAVAVYTGSVSIPLPVDVTPSYAPTQADLPPGAVVDSSCFCAMVYDPGPDVIEYPTPPSVLSDTP